MTGLYVEHVVHNYKNYKKSKTTQFILTHIWHELEQDMSDILDICSTSILYFEYFENHLITSCIHGKVWFKQNICFNILCALVSVLQTENVLQLWSWTVLYNILVFNRFQAQSTKIKQQ